MPDEPPAPFQAPAAVLDAVACRMQAEPSFTTGDVAFWLMQAGVPGGRFRRRGPAFDVAAQLVERERAAGRVAFQRGAWVPCPPRGDSPTPGVTATLALVALVSLALLHWCAAHA